MNGTSHTPACKCCGEEFLEGDVNEHVLLLDTSSFCPSCARQILDQVGEGALVARIGVTLPEPLSNADILRLYAAGNIVGVNERTPIATAA